MRAWAAIAALALLLAGCESSGGGTGSTDSSGIDGWTKPLGTTTCVEYRNVMTVDQEFAVAKVLIRVLGAKDTSDDFARDFEDGLLKGCDVPSVKGLKLSDIAAGIAVLEGDQFD